MTRNEFIFSNKLKYRLARHLAFWSVFFIQIILLNLPVGGFNDVLKYQSYKQAVISSSPALPVCVFSVYVFLYFLFPLLQKKKYAALLFAVMGVLFFNCVIELFTHLILRPYTCPNCPAATLLEKINMIESVGINLAFFLSTLALGIKFTKHWYLQQIQNRLLAGQKITNQLKLLKSRIQPEFLFEALQVLHNKITVDKNQASEILLRLSELLSYMLYESNNDFVPLQKELFIIQEFIALENMMQGKRINFINDITRNLNERYIPSFTLLSLIQNCALALQTDEPKKPGYLNIKLNTDDIMLYCTIYIRVENTVNKKKYTGIINDFRNRLETLYKNNYRLEFFETTGSSLTVTLSLLLSNLSAYKTEKTPVIPYVYAAE